MFIGSIGRSAKPIVGAEQRAIERMKELRRQGHSLRAISARLAEEYGVSIAYAGIAKVIGAPEMRR